MAWSNDERPVKKVTKAQLDVIAVLKENPGFILRRRQGVEGWRLLNSNVNPLQNLPATTVIKLQEDGILLRNNVANNQFTLNTNFRYEQN